MNTLLIDNKTASGGTVAEQFEKKNLEKEKNEIDTAVLKDIVIMNFISIWKGEKQAKTCKCGSKLLCSMDNIPIKYHKDGKIKEMMVQGMICGECNRKQVAEKTLLSIYHEIEG